MGTAIEEFVAVWVLGFCGFLILFAFSTWVLSVSGRLSDEKRAVMGQLTDPWLFARVIFSWFITWPFILLKGIAVAIESGE